MQNQKTKRIIFFILSMLIISWAVLITSKAQEADTTAPTVPTNLTATVISSSQIDLTWAASTDDTGVTGYNIYRCTGSCTPSVSIGTSATNSYSDTGLTAEAIYTYAVSAYDILSNTSANSTSASAITDVAPTITGNVYYVSPKESFTLDDTDEGLTAWTNAVNIENPTSVKTAMNYAVAGDTVYFRGGTYYAGISPSYAGWWEPVNGGQEGSPITFIAYPGEVPIMDADATGKWNSRAFGNHDWSYIIFDGFTLRASGGLKLGGIIIDGHDYGRRPVGCVIRNCIFDGGSTVITDGSTNMENIRLENTDYVTISNNILVGPPATQHNASSIKHYDTNYVTIENNDFSGAYLGVYLKQNANNTVIRNNYFHDNESAILLSMLVGTENLDVSIYNNIFNNNSYSHIGSLEDNEDATSDNLTIFNNTFVNGARGIGIGPNRVNNGAVLYNNIFYNTDKTITTTELSGDIKESDHNLFYNIINIRMRLYGDLATYLTLPTWQSSSELEGGGDPGVGSLWGNPLFINISGTMSEIADFSLASNSPAKNAGRDGVDMGANIDLVGIQSSFSTDTIPPSRSAGSPSGELSYGTTSTTISLTTNESATCKYSTVSGVAYSSMTNTFSTTGTTSHSTSITGLNDGTIYNYYVKCEDSSGNSNTDDYEISFSVQVAPTTYTLTNFISAITNWLGIGNETSDVNSDGVVNTRDLGVMMSGWGE